MDEFYLSSNSNLNTENSKISDKVNNLKVGIICPSPKGKEIAVKLQNSFKGKLYIKESNVYKIYSYTNVDNSEVKEEYYNGITSLNDVAKDAIETVEGIIFISSTGIAVRAIAPFIKGKDKDPGVVVVDLANKYAISLLSGHLGGGNELALKAADILRCMPIITTATDNLGIIAPDMIAKENNFAIEDLKKAKYISSLLVDGKSVGIKDDFGVINITKGYRKINELKENSIWITNKLEYIEANTNLDFSKVLKLVKKNVVLGIGCRKGTAFEKLYDFIESSLKKYNYDIKSVTKIVSICVKKHEEGIIKLAEKLDCEFQTFEIEEVKKVQHKYEKSEFVLKTLGVTGVCEPCVDLAGANVVINKIKHKGMTLSIGVLNI